LIDYIFSRSSVKNLEEEISVFVFNPEDAWLFWELKDYIKLVLSGIDYIFVSACGRKNGGPITLA
jgi:hypothetical protein